MATKFQLGDRVVVNEKLFPSYDEGLFNALAKNGTVVQVDPESILPYRVKIDKFEHHPFWFYENQLLFEDALREKTWAEANAPKPRPPGAAGKAPAPAHAHAGEES